MTTLIPTSCRHCLKAYRVKAEFAGKTVKCPNPACQKPMPVPVPKSAAEVEAAALRALSEEPEVADVQVIAVTCEMCEHRWEVPKAMQGKNVLCPDCRHRNKVPIPKVPKAADWKTGGGRPSLARVEELDGVVASTDLGRVSGEALRGAGVVVEVYEPRSARFWLAAVGGPLVLLAGLTYLVLSYARGKAAATTASYLKVALEDQEANKDAPVPPAEWPLFRGALAVAAGEHLTRQNDPARLREAVTQFARGRQEIDAAGAGAGRTLLLMELAAAQVGLAGTDQQVEAGVRLRWAPGGRMKLNEKQFTVQGELTDTLAVVRQESKLVSLADRQVLARRLARLAAAAGQPDALDGVLPKLFSDAEAADGQALVALESLKATGDLEAAKRKAAELAPLAGGGAGPYLQALAVAAGPVPGLNAPPPPAAGQPPSDPARQAHTAALLLARQFDAAVELAGRGKSPDTRGSRGLALALAAEWADDPKPAVLAAAEVVEREGKPRSAGMPDGTLIRLAAAAGRAGLPEAVETFVRAVDKDDARAWAQALAVRGRYLANPSQPPADADLKVPDGDKDVRSGMAWQLLTAARQAGRADPRVSTATFDRWGNGTFKPFGYAGLALGRQDAGE
jgi:hypothetical protein